MNHGRGRAFCPQPTILDYYLQTVTVCQIGELAHHCSREIDGVRSGLIDRIDFDLVHEHPGGGNREDFPLDGGSLGVCLDDSAEDYHSLHHIDLWSGGTVAKYRLDGVDRRSSQRDVDFSKRKFADRIFYRPLAVTSASRRRGATSDFRRMNAEQLRAKGDRIGTCERSGEKPLEERNRFIVDLLGVRRVAIDSVKRSMHDYASPIEQ